MRALRFATLFLIGATTVVAQEPQAPAPVSNPTFSERVEVRVLDLDVDVTDSKGQPVPDLKKDDFTVKIGGKPVAIDWSTPSRGRSSQWKSRLRSCRSPSAGAARSSCSVPSESFC